MLDWLGGYGDTTEEDLKGTWTRYHASKGKY